MILPRSKTYLITLGFQRKVFEQVKKKPVKKATISINSYSIEDLKVKEDFVPSEFTVVSCNVFENLSSRANGLVCKIISELHQNNALWVFDHRTNKRDQKAISELRTKGILFKTEDTIVHFVNPMILRRGKQIAVVFCMIELLENSSRVTPDMARPLRMRASGAVNPVEVEEACADVA